MSVNPFGAPSRALPTLGVALTAAAALIATTLCTPLAAAAAPMSDAPRDARTITQVDVFESDDDADGVIDSRSTTTVVIDSKGRLLSLRADNDIDADGVIDDALVETYSYDHRGRPVLAVRETFEGADPFPVSRVTIQGEYAKSGELFRLTERVDSDADGVVDTTSVSETTWGKKPTSVTETWHTDADNDGEADDVFATYSEYDHRGNHVLQRSTTDLDDDGVIDERFESSYTYSKSGALLTEHATVSIEGNEWTTDTVWSYGSRDVVLGYTIVESSGNVVSVSIGYDDQGRIVRISETSDWEGDGIVDFTYVESSTWGDGDLLLSSVVETGLDLAGASPLYERTTMTFTHDEEGRQVSWVYDTDTGADGTLDSRSEWWSTWEDGLPVSDLTTTDGDGDGDVDRSTLNTYGYDENGNLIQVITEADDDGDGVVDSRQTYTRTTIG
ncbi:hypothetical protein [Microbacterium sp. CFBP9034]|uniref:hypothetical protein n=1 Tax=Microbacterium sp. CFBP9034 TaxID=3096540 RepID=UPI002A69DCCC|nr:hypothetical protein [Microbacterium sp. CFBP9034]MDY0910948.1 hypothetical protein [Microbacterium sp. CFBP9034]